LSADSGQCFLLAGLRGSGFFEDGLRVGAGAFFVGEADTAAAAGARDVSTPSTVVVLP
jgi:hypothetical protein